MWIFKLTLKFRAKIYELFVTHDIKKRKQCTYITCFVKQSINITLYITNIFYLGKYAPIEASAPRRPGDKAILKIYGSGEDRCLSFAFHMSGTNVGSLSVYQQELGKGVSPAQLWIRSGNQGKRWQEAEVNIEGYHQYKVMTFIVIIKSSTFHASLLTINQVGA